MLRLIGGGSYGKVWLARSVLGEYRAVKVVRRDQFTEDRPYDREFDGIRRFEAVSRRHAGLVDVLHAGQGDGFFYYVMELADDACGEAGKRRGGEKETSGPSPSHSTDRPLAHSQNFDPATYEPKTLRRWLQERLSAATPSPKERASEILTPRLRFRAWWNFSRTKGSPSSRPSSPGEGEPLAAPLAGNRLHEPGSAGILAGETIYAQQAGRDAGDPRGGSPVQGFKPGNLHTENPLPVEQCLEIAMALADALAYLHQNGLVHRDIKPSNVIFVQGQPKLADIGLVAEANVECSFVGTEGFVAPEGPGEPQADPYALGKVLYEMMTGFRAKSYPKVPDEWAKTPERKKLLELNQVVLKACEAKVRRYRTAEAMREDLEVLKLKKSLIRLRRLERNVKWLGLGLAGAAAMLIFGGAIFGFIFYKNRAAVEASSARLGAAKLLRSAWRESGWFSNNWSRLQQTPLSQRTDEWRADVVAVLAGLDALNVCSNKDFSAASACFGPDGNVLIGGSRGSPGLIVGTNGTVTKLPVRNEGPVCWPSDDVPLQFVASNSCSLLEMRTGSVRRSFPLQPGEDVNYSIGPVLAVTLDGTRVAAAITGRVDRVAAWDARTGESLGEFPMRAEALAFTPPDGSVMAAGRADGVIELFALSGMKRVSSVPSPGRPITTTCLALGRDPLVHYEDEAHTNRWLLAAGYQGGEVIVWDLWDVSKRFHRAGSDWNVFCVALDPSGATLATAGRNHPQLWDIMGQQLLLKLSVVSAEEAGSLAFNAGGTRLVCGTGPDVRPSGIGVWELVPQRGVHLLRGLGSPPRKVWFSADCSYIAAVSDDWHLGIWEARNDRLLWVFQVPMGEYADNAGGVFDMAGERFAFAAGKEARLYDLATGRTLRKWRLRMGLSDHLQFQTNGLLRLARREQGPGQKYHNWWRLYELSDAPERKLVREQNEANRRTMEVYFPANGDTFVARQRDGDSTINILRAYNWNSGAPVWEKVTVENDALIRGEQTGKWLVYSPSHRDTNHVLMLSTGEMADLVRASLLCISGSGDRHVLQSPVGIGWLVSNRGGATLDLPVGSDWQRISDPVLSPDGRLLAWGTVAGALVVADLDEVQKRLDSLQSPRR